ncbi:hypothetical protein [Kaistia nematophila]|uniref:Lipoprotein n=1 Tax=Kaistia nematophila TaxID=2994654 RepID=A0A9X3IN85_9HYPH|nr:hypothetical protein [Kaistia nematophila]MCX5571712.1 hypothetical protein [Kaistia nematophila]
MRIAILALLGFVAGCSTTHTATGPATGPSSGLQQAYQACQTSYDNHTLKTRAERARCINAAENQFASEFPDRELLRRQQGLRLSLAMQVDQGKISQATADAAYKRELTRLQAASAAHG